MIVSNSISKVRDEVQEMIGREIVVRCNKGKRNTTVSKGIVKYAYSSVFTVEFEGLDKRITTNSFSYTDLITKSVEFLNSDELINVQ